MMDDMVEPGGSPGPRGQNARVKALGENAAAASDSVAVEPSRHDHQSKRPACQGQVRQAPMISAGDPLRAGSASRTRAQFACRTDGDPQACIVTDGVVHNEPGWNQGRRAEGLAHGIDSSCEINANRILNSIKSESEPNLHAETQAWSTW